jgi:hypothetical protein
MEIGKAVYKLLKDSADVGAICADRIYPEMAQQDVDVPFIVYTVTDTTPSGTKNATSKLDTGRVELYCISDDYEQAMNLGIAVRSALDRQSGTISAVEVQSIDFDTSDIQFDPDQRVYVLEQTYDVRIQRTGTAQVVSQFPGNTFTVEEVDGDPSGAVNKLVFSNGSVSITDRTATITTGGGAFTDLSDTPGTLGTAGQVVAVNTGGTALEFVDQSGAAVQYHGRYDTEAETERSGATATLEVYYTARPDGDGFAESEVSDVGETDTINRTLYYSTKYLADPDTAGDWTEYTTQPADNATFATAKAALLAGLNETDATAETRGTLPLSLKMVRTTSAAATDLLLDTYTGAAAAYSVRKLDKDYTGYCMKVRRASDDAEADIGFDSNGDLDTAAIATHCGASAGYVSVWYDQANIGGTANNATQSTPSEQPQIYNGTAVITENGKPALDFPSPGGFQNTTISASSSDKVSMFSVAAITGGSVGFMMHTSELDGYRLPIARSGNSNAPADGVGSMSFFKDGSSATVTTRGECYTEYVDSTQHLMTIFGTLSTAITSGNTNALGMRATADTNYPVNGPIQELIIYYGATDQSSNRTGIESDINTYFSIYT